MQGLHGIRHGYGDTNVVEQRKIRDVIADISALGNRDAKRGNDLVQCSNLVTTALDHVWYAQLGHTFLHSPGLTAADDGNLDASIQELPNTVSILGMESFRFNTFI
jgi:hypothetical protein